ncbi:hypothetical protein DMX11_21520 [Pseudomonas sp. LB-090624]|nr:hypothetical protein DMX11_21520 [Pseudomonas sp. LB-090624]
MTILFRLQGAFGWFSYTTSRDTIRTDHVPRPIGVGHAPESWPVQRYDRVLAALKWAPPGGSG